MPSNIRLAENFRLLEFYVSDSQPDLAYEMYLNSNNFQTHLAFNLATDAQLMRDYVGVPIIITSGYRSEELNRITGGAASKSLHTQFLAFDCKCKKLKELYDYIINNLVFSECFLYQMPDGTPTNIHYARQTAGYTNKRHGILVRIPNGKPIPIEEYNGQNRS